MNPLHSLFARSNRYPESESAARAKRARDHLEKKRDRERSRLSRDRARQEIKASRKRTLRIATPLLTGAAIALGYALATPIAEGLWLNDARLTRVAVQGQTDLTPAAVAAYAGAIAGMPLDDVNPEQIRDTLVASPWIQSARVLRLPTGTLVVRVEERSAIARWQTAVDTRSVAGDRVEGLSDSGEPTHLAEGTTPEIFSDWIDETGGRFSGTDAPDRALPLVRGDAFGTDVLSDDALLILTELAQHASLSEDPATLTLHLPGLIEDEDGVLRGSPAGFVLEVGNKGPRALLGRRLLPQRVARLASLLDEANETVRTATLIDLRYADRAVLRTESTSG